jgi:hypothetical protein
MLKGGLLQELEDFKEEFLQPRSLKKSTILRLFELTVLVIIVALFYYGNDGELTLISILIGAFFAILLGAIFAIQISEFTFREPIFALERNVHRLAFIGSATLASVAVGGVLGLFFTMYFSNERPAAEHYDPTYGKPVKKLQAQEGSSKKRIIALLMESQHWNPAFLEDCSDEIGLSMPNQSSVINKEFPVKWVKNECDAPPVQIDLSRFVDRFQVTKINAFNNSILIGLKMKPEYKTKRTHKPEIVLYSLAGVAFQTFLSDFNQNNKEDFVFAPSLRYAHPNLKTKKAYIVKSSEEELIVTVDYPDYSWKDVEKFGAFFGIILKD